MHEALSRPELLVPVPRSDNRRKLGITTRLPFTGMDIWTAYELSWLNDGGKPEIGIATFLFPADSPNLIESKSLKQYLHSVNQARFDSRGALVKLLENDLGRAAGAPVTAAISPSSAQSLSELEGESLDGLEVRIETYEPDASFLVSRGPAVSEMLRSDLLKTNCPLSGQPDWASLQVRYRGPKIDREGLLRYIVSFRNFCDFHEHCVERIFLDLLNRCRPEALTVYARYTRRGGLDINPFRTNAGDPIPENVRTGRQ